jgi:hypothetical protein
LAEVLNQRKNFEEVLKIDYLDEKFVAEDINKHLK